MASPFTSRTGVSGKGIDVKFRINQNELQRCLGVLTNAEADRLGRIAQAAIKKAAPVGPQRTYKRGSGGRKGGSLRKAVNYERQKSGFLIRINSEIAPHAAAVIFGRRAFTLPQREAGPYRWRKGGRGGRVVFSQGPIDVGAVAPNDFVTDTFEETLKSAIK